ncbi:dGTP triphosphohydrolase [Bacillus gaemokensis]|uniref:dGTP triphosphohydrolase n=1 Tax=Bacillus gaemokensis TaxID=574375 RepID=A0A073KFU8_9BACI|nr:dGTP triphosphohydrolase [Bacillus gaemokensis]KEK25420.1 dGTP triphosphohydrolase [Bacillus gaemokensis]KYG37137.1 dGTP triphosphohydrolase [Bacillus gaemokensis]
MKRASNQIVLLWIAQILFYFITVHMTSYSYAFFFTIIYVCINLLFLFIPNKPAFTLFITVTLLSVFYLFYESWLYLWSTSAQLHYIIIHFLAIANFFLIYISTYMLKKLLHENRRLQAQVQTLEQYIGETKLLTRNEFERRGLLLEAAMKRRGETGMLVYFSFASFSNYTKRSVIDRVATLLLETVRSDFDLVGKYDEKTLVILLQNTNEYGVHIVMQRLQKKWKEWLTKDAISTINIKQEQLDGQRLTP